jgi:hypothetical protein
VATPLQQTGIPAFPFEDDAMRFPCHGSHPAPDAPERVRFRLLPQRNPSRSCVDLQSMNPRTVAARVASRLHLRPLSPDPGVFPPVADAGVSSPVYFLSWSFTLPQGSVPRTGPLVLPVHATGQPPASLPWDLTPLQRTHPENRPSRTPRGRAGQREPAPGSRHHLESLPRSPTARQPTVVVTVSGP